MSIRFEQASAPAVTRDDGKIVMTMTPRQAKLLAASLWLAPLISAEQVSWLDTIAEMVSDAANLYGSIARSSTSAPAALSEALERGSDDELEVATAVEAAAVQAAVIAAEAVLVAAERAKAAALAAQQARAAVTLKTASTMAETVRQQALAAQAHAETTAREAAAAAMMAATRVASAVLPGHEVEARRAAALVAQITNAAVAAAAEETALLAAAAARAAAAAAMEAAAEAADAAMLVELEVHSTARAVQDTAEVAATQLAAETRKASPSPLGRR